MTTEIANLVHENKNLIYSIAHNFRQYHNKEDLFQVGVIGIIQAYKNFDDKHGVKFTTYAYPYILGEMKKYIREDKGIKVSRDLLKLNFKIEKANILLSQKLMREPTIKELAAYLEVPELLIEQAINLNNAIQSFEEPINNNDNKEMTLHDVISGVEQLDLDSLIALKDEIKQLDKLDQKIVVMRYFNDFTQTEVADMLGINQVQVSRKEQKILQKLRSRLND
ncbi:MAG: sigma-70 family RNA polymerase sigma factor [Mollicutes bacterium]|nr:sigma-70 family RNA polymerase sigma factor [Mollicutes bacterium]